MYGRQWVAPAAAVLLASCALGLGCRKQTETVSAAAPASQPMPPAAEPPPQPTSSESAESLQATPPAKAVAKAGPEPKPAPSLQATEREPTATLQPTEAPKTTAPGTSGPRPAPHETPKAGSSQTVARSSLNWENSLTSALSKASSTNTPVLALCYAKDYGDVWRLRTEGMNDPEVAALAREFICVLVDLDQNREAREKYRIRAVPTVLFLSPAGDLVHSFQGFGSAARLAGEIRKATGKLAAGRAGRAGSGSE